MQTSEKIEKLVLLQNKLKTKKVRRNRKNYY